VSGAVDTSGKRGPIRRFVEALVDVSIRHPIVVILCSLLLVLGARQYITARLELRSDFLELLPRDSPSFIAFEQQLKRVGGGASLFIVVESPDRAANERFIDDVSKKVTALQDERAKCVKDACGKDVQASGLRDGDIPACAAKCGPELISYSESGSKEVRAFFKANKWMYASIQELEDADRTLDNQIAVNSGLVTDLEHDDDLEEKPKPAPNATLDAGAGAGSKENPDKKPALGMDEHKKKWDDQANKHDDFPTGYFATTDGRMLGMRIISPTTGTGDKGGDILLAKVQDIVKEMNVGATYHEEMRVGYAGDIPNAIAEKNSIVSEAALATGIATVLILFGVFAFFRSFSAVAIMFLPALLGVACAYSFATATFGYVNTSGAFLGAIILGNGINYPIVLLGRYKEFTARGMSSDDAKRVAVWNAFRAELVGASVAGIAYGSLTITRFRGFSQFGMIGFVGMLLVWLSIIPLVPATITIVEWIRGKHALAERLFNIPPFKWAFPGVDPDGSCGPLVKLVAKLTEKWPIVFVGIAVVVTGIALVKIPHYLHDPWEYNFSKLGSKGSKKGGAGEWSVKAEKVFGGKMNVAGAMMLADKPEQVLAVKEQILKNDLADPAGRTVADVSTIHDLLPGTVKEQEAKLAILERIRDRLSPRVLHDVKSEEERQRLIDMKPPATLKVLEPKDVPALLRRHFEEKNGTIGTVFYVKYNSDMSLSDGHNLLRIAKTTDNVKLADGTVVHTASRSSVFAEMIRSMERDGPLASFASLAAVSVVVLAATASFRGFVCVIISLVIGVIWMVGGAAWTDAKLNFLNFIALPITFGIGCEYPFNIFDRSRLLGGDITTAVRRSGGAVALCSYTTTVGYGSLLFADNQALQSFGQLAMGGEIATLVTALFVLPSLLHLWKAPHGTVSPEHALTAGLEKQPAPAPPPEKTEKAEKPKKPARADSDAEE